MNTDYLVSSSITSEINKIVKTEAEKMGAGIKLNVVELGGRGDCFWRSFIYLMMKMGVDVKDVFSFNVEKVINVWMSSEILMSYCEDVMDLIVILREDFDNTTRSEVNYLTMIYLAELFDTSIMLYSVEKIVLIGESKSRSVSIYHYTNAHFAPIVSFL